jgi:replicative DNA helicase
MSLDERARDLLEQFASGVEPRLAEFGDLGSMTDWAGKLVGAVARIAGLLHMARWAADRTGWIIPVNRETVADAIGLGNYFVAHAKIAFAEMGADPAVEDARYVLRWLEAHIEARRGLTVSRHDIHQGTRARFKRMADLEPALRLLEEYGYIRVRVTEDRTGAGRKPGPVYDVNPLWRTHNSRNTHNDGRRPKSGGSVHLVNSVHATDVGDDGYEEFVL